MFDVYVIFDIYVILLLIVIKILSNYGNLYFLLFMVNYIYISLFFFYCYGSDGYFYYMYCVDRRIYCDGK